MVSVGGLGHWSNLFPGAFPGKINDINMIFYLLFFFISFIIEIISRLSFFYHFNTYSLCFFFFFKYV